MQLEKLPFRLREVAGFIYETFQLKACDKNLQWKIETGSDVPSMVMGDSARLTQVLMNLVGNAMKFTDKGTVELAVTASQSATENLQPESCRVHFKITDTGTGISKDQLEKIFENFVQADDNHKKQGGTGLGLSFSKNLVQLMNGKLLVKSEIGKGSEFSFSIPVEIATDQQWQEHHRKELVYEEDLGEEFHDINILIAEDNEYKQLLIADTLKKFIPGVKIEMVNNGKELLARLRDQNHEIILMDVQMPVMDGYEATAVIRNQLMSRIPIIALTASVIKTDIEKCLAAGMNSYVPKPFSSKELLSVMAGLLGKNINARMVAKKEIPMPFEHPSNTFTYRWIKLDSLHQLVSGDPVQVNRYLKLFHELIPIRMAALKEALQKQDYLTIRKTVHVMKPQMASVGLERAKKLAENIESNYHREERIAADVTELMNDCAAALEEVRHELSLIL
ncbi:MAG: ATP-binding protein [Chitinophagales bacterium]